MIPEFAPSPARGDYVPVGALAVSLPGLPAGYSVTVALGSSKGDSDLGVVSIITPAAAAFVVPAGPPRVFVSSIVTAPFFWTEQWSYGVGVADNPEASSTWEAVSGYLAATLKRSALSGLAVQVDVPDSGHGLDEICPLTPKGQLFDISKGVGIAPFSAVQVRGSEAVEGAGYITLALSPAGVLPGVPGFISNELYRAEHEIYSPVGGLGGGGQRLANIYAGALKAAWQGERGTGAMIHPLGGPQSNYITTQETPPVMPVWNGDDGQWRRDRWDVVLLVSSRIINTC